MFEWKNHYKILPEPLCTSRFITLHTTWVENMYISNLIFCGKLYVYSLTTSILLPLLSSQNMYFYSGWVSFISHISVCIQFRPYSFPHSFYSLRNPCVDAWMLLLLLSKWWITAFTFLSGNKNMKQNKTRTRCKLNNEKGEMEVGQGFLHVFSKKNRGRMLI